MNDIMAEELQRLQQGEQKAWDAFFSRHNDLIVAVVSWSKWRFTPQTREDVAQSIRASLFKAIASYNKDASLEYYVKRICINQCIDEVRRQIRARQHTVSLSLAEDGSLSDSVAFMVDTTQDPIQEVVNSEMAIHVKKILGELDELCRTAIVRFYFSQQSYKEISTELGIAINTVGSRLAKCLEKVRKKIRIDPFLREVFPGSCDRGGTEGELQHEQD